MLTVIWLSGKLEPNLEAVKQREEPKRSAEEPEEELALKEAGA
jgi:hypothetical protein